MDDASNPDLTPFTTSSTDASGQTKTLSGYGPRRPIQPPNGGGIPDMRQGIISAYQHLPVDQATKAIEAASKYIGMRGYQKDLQSGKSSAEAFSKWAPMLFRTATGIPEALNITKPQAPKLHFGSKGEIVQETGNAAAPFKVLRAAEQAPTKPPVLSEAQKEDLRDSYEQMRDARKDMAKSASKALSDPDVQDAHYRMRDAHNRIAKIVGAPTLPDVPGKLPTKPEEKPQATAPAKEVVRVTKDGKRAVFDAATKSFIRWADGK